MTAQATAAGRLRKIVALCGGVGGAKLAYGLNRLLGEKLTLVINTGDDFEHLGFWISPDIDTVVYTLGGLSDDERGWGRAGESWNFIEALGGLGGETWFRLGDRDLATHVQRTLALRAGRTLTEFTRQMAKQVGIAATLLPMTDARFSTMVVTPEGRLPFQRYFVEQQSRPVVRRIEFEHADDVKASAEALRALQAPDLDAIIVCPSNPYLSVDPILRVPGILAALESVSAPVIAVSPLIGGQAVKGPTAKIMQELGVPTSAASIALHYPFLSGLVIDRLDEAQAARLKIPAHVTNTLMRSKDDRVNLAAECLDFIARLKK
ncbi:2-phospho-L-lactate transferase [Bradyrhizobium sp. NP1]|uniref:2-phospho-L-lactate transferase n=1 Tax=Bradyrhizobium sp. NP1 TaxID=3049772 RepID=UPI0025A4F349|nr:2-phospho-L-lactate transferase [Bradyrhizobium sp. NP1]WJR77881.1 2-phospho-L-lactate transferase [Bradyrhizobium sp. NP1]